MSDRISVHASNMAKIVWDSPATTDFVEKDGVSVHMALVIKETTTLHRVLSKYFPSEPLKLIMTQIFRSYNQRLEEEYRRIDLFSSAGKNRLLIDAQYYISQLSSLEGVDGPGNQIEVCVNNIKIKDKRTYVPPAPPKTNPQPPANQQIQGKQTSSTSAPHGELHFIACPLCLILSYAKEALYARDTQKYHAQTRSNTFWHFVLNN